MSWTVLCITDNASRLRLYQSVLELEGHSAFFAATIADAINVCSTALVDCVVIDRIDGLPFTRALCQAVPKIPILFVTDEWPRLFQIYRQVRMFISNEEAIEQLPQCIEEAIERNALESLENDCAFALGKPDATRGSLHQAFIRWIFPW